MFQNNAEQRKKSISNKLAEVLSFISNKEYQEAIDKLLNDVRSKMDGYVDGNPKNDWITDQKSQNDLCSMIDAFVVYLESTRLHKQILSTEPIEPPAHYCLYQNYPNPFNSETTIRFQIPEPKHVVLKVFNIFGQEIKTLVNRLYESGYYTINWDGKDKNGNNVSSGIYFLCIRAGEFIDVKKMSLLR